jgi:hypothetical protein
LSVIFRTLKKLRGASREEEEKRYRLKRRGNVYSFRRLLSSPRRVILVALLVIISGLFAAYAAPFLRILFTGDNGQPVSQMTEETLPVNINATSEDGVLMQDVATLEATETFRDKRVLEDLPEPPANIPVEEAEAEGLHLPSSPRKSLARQTWNAEYLPPGSQEELETASSRNMSETFPAKSDRRNMAAVEDPESKPEEALGSKESTDLRTKRIHMVNVKKTAGITRLVSKAERSISSGDFEQADTLIGELELLKGKENSYVMKLRAVWYMRQGDFKSAASLLNTVLERDQDDLDAGINMAVIEIKTNRLDEAHKRLAALGEVYQANTRIPELIRKIGK